MIRSILLTGTRAPATLDLARRLWREGLRVVGADSMRFPLGRFSRAFASHHRVPPPRQDREGFLRAIRQIAADQGVDLIWPTCEEVLHVAVGRDALDPVSRVFSPSLDTLVLLHQKLNFARWAAALDTEVRVPESVDAAAAPREGRWVWKPVYSRFAARTRFAAPVDRDGWMVQRFVRGREFSTWALCVAGEVTLLTQYTCPARSGRGAGVAFSPYWSRQAAEFTATVARTLRYDGSLAFDFIEADEGGETYVLECNPRLTSGVHLLSPDTSLRAALEGGAGSVPAVQRPAQLFLPTLLSSPRLAGSSPDVVRSPGDGRPAWAQGLALVELAWRAVTGRRSILEATTMDIEYDGH